MQNTDQERALGALLARHTNLEVQVDALLVIGDPDSDDPARYVIDTNGRILSQWPLDPPRSSPFSPTTFQPTPKPDPGWEPYPVDTDPAKPQGFIARHPHRNEFSGDIYPTREECAAYCDYLAHGSD